jgi:hypothetical protein
MQTPYSGRADLGDVEVVVAIPNVDVRDWLGEVSGARPAESFRDGPVTVVLLDQPRPGWFATAHVERRRDGSGCLTGASRFRPRL